jgi:tetratricopeptide (TPR) repeat protein
MSLKSILSSAVLLSLIAAGVAAAMSSGSSDPPITRDPNLPGLGQSKPTARQEAELAYALSYEEVGKAKKDLEAGKTKNAEKHFRKAVEYGEKAVMLDERYHEAWNLIGFASRKLGDYDRSFKAYERCLAIKPDYAPAREYLGEAWLDKGDAKKAREQLIWLQRLGADVEFKELQAAYDRWAAAHPDSAAAAPAAEPARADSAGVGSEGGTGN